MAELVCSVEYTWWLVMAARNAISAVALTADFAHQNNVQVLGASSSECRWRNRVWLDNLFTDVCRIIAIGYSTGSSNVSDVHARC